MRELSLIFLLLAVVQAQVSKPFASDMSHKNNSGENKFLNRDIVAIEKFVFGKDHSGFQPHSKCPLKIHHSWHSAVDGSVYGTPVIHDVNSDGVKDIVFTTFLRHIEVLDGHHGHPVAGWPFTLPNSVFHSSPLMYDINGDGFQEIGIVTYNAELIWFHENGTPVFGKSIKVPGLKVNKGWYEGLDLQAANSELYNKHSRAPASQQDAPGEDEEEVSVAGGEGVVPVAPAHGGAERKLLTADMGEEAVGEDEEELLDVEHHKPLHSNNEGTWASIRGWLTEEGTNSLLGSLPSNHEITAFRDFALQDKVFAGLLDLSADHPEDDNEDDEDGTGGKNGTAPHAKNRDTVTVDPHIFATPVISDVDGDGRDDIVFAVSYFFDHEHYNDPSAYSKLDVDVDISKYVAGGIVVYDLISGQKKWDIHLDLTTDSTKYRAYIHGSPVVADLGDGKGMAVIVGTSVGFIYVLDAAHGTVRSGFPVQMGEIQGQIAVADVNGDGFIELIACDSNHNVAVWTHTGRELWSRHVSGFSAQGPKIGDVNGDADGVLDIVIATTNGHLWALNGKTGAPLPHFPQRMGGRILSAPALLQLNPQKQHLSIVVPAHDGKLYIVDGKTGCEFKIDISEQSYSMILADDLTGNGKLDLVMSTMNGNVFVLGTDADYHPLRALTTDQGKALSVGPRLAIYAINRDHRDISGSHWKLEFEIIDTRPASVRPKTYKVRVSIGGRIVLLSKEVSAPGVYVETLPAPRRRQFATLILEISSGNGFVTTDSFSVSFNMHFYKTLKWIIVLPFFAMFFIVVFVKDIKTALPL